MALLHYPVLDRQGRVINTAVTNMDLHDMARVARTYQVEAMYVVQPLELQKKLVRRLASYWTEGRGGEYNLTRKQAFEKLRLCDTLEEALGRIESETGERPKVIGTSAKRMPGALSAAEMRKEMEKGRAWLVLFGTGWGIDPGFLEQNADCMIEPVQADSDYNHLSVRTAAAVVMDRLLAAQR